MIDLKFRAFRYAGYGLPLAMGTGLFLVIDASDFRSRS